MADKSVSSTALNNQKDKGKENKEKTTTFFTSFFKLLFYKKLHF